MGQLDVHIRHGGGGIDPKAVLVVAGALLLLGGGGTIAATAVAAVTTLLVWLAVAVGVLLVAAVALGIVFRERIKANLFRPLVVGHGWKPLNGAAPEPVRAEQPKQELHLHFHGDSDVDRAILALKVASLHNESRMIGPGRDYDPVTGLHWDVLEGKVVRE